MNYKKLIADAWDFTLKNKSLVRYYAFWPAIFAAASTILIVLFQSTSILTKAGQTNIHLFSDMFEFSKQTFAADPKLFWILVLGGLFVFILEIFLPIFCEGASIHIIAQRYRGNSESLSSGIKYGWLNFVKLTEYHAVLFAFSSFTILRIMGYIFIYLSADALRLFFPFLIVLFILGVVFSFLFTYAENFIVIDGQGVFESLKHSSDLVLDNLKQTFLMLFLLALIGLRVLLNVLIVVLFPVLLSILASLLTALNLLAYKFIITVLVGLLSLWMIGKLGGALIIFTQAAWTFTFLELKDKQLGRQHINQA